MERTFWDSSLLVSLTLWDSPVLFAPPLPLPQGSPGPEAPGDFQTFSGLRVIRAPETCKWPTGSQCRNASFCNISVQTTGNDLAGVPGLALTICAICPLDQRSIPNSTANFNQKTFISCDVLAPYFFGGRFRGLIFMTRCARHLYRINYQSVIFRLA